jgi:hypothetical protein
MNTYKGYSLFDEVKDQALRTRNRAVVMANMYEDYPDPENKDYVSRKGALMIFTYMERVPEKERAELVTEFHKQMGERGYESVA